MANEAELFGLPQVLINFRTQGTTAIKRSARGIVAMILHDGAKNEIQQFRISDTTDIPDEILSAKSVELVKLCLKGTPLRVLLYVIPEAGTEVEPEGHLADQNDVLDLIQSVKWNWVCNPTSTGTEQADLSSWVIAQRNNKRKTFKAVCAKQAADHEGVVNFCTDDIVAENGTDENGDPVYTTYNAVQYTARIAGILAGLALDRSATYFALTEVQSVESYTDIDERIDKGQLLLFDEQDGNGVKIARACNSLITFTTDKGEDFRYIKIIEALDMITDDIRDTFKKYYVGKVINDYNHKMLFITAVLVYFDEIKGNVLDRDGKNTVDIDEQAQLNYAKLHGEKTEDMSAMEIRKYNTGTRVMLTGNIKPVNAMEDLTINFVM
ncbi:MAG: phage tail sheath protein [Selenomonadaceae bacterium]|nr:phage tail sheath protein [Selenomonadaceae bacterium]